MTRRGLFRLLPLVLLSVLALSSASEHIAHLLTCFVHEERRAKNRQDEEEYDEEDE